MYTGRGGGGGGGQLGGARGIKWKGGGSWCVCVCVGVRSDIFSDISRRYCIVPVCFIMLLPPRLFLFVIFTVKSCYFTTFFFWVMKSSKE